MKIKFLDKLLHKHEEKFLQPTPKKFLITALLFAAFAAISPAIFRVLVLDAHLRGLPLPFAFQTAQTTEFFWLSFFVDLGFWYLAACLFAYLNRLVQKG